MSLTVAAGLPEYTCDGSRAMTSGAGTLIRSKKREIDDEFLIAAVSELFVVRVEVSISGA